MQLLEEKDLDQIMAGGDSFAADAGQLLGGGVGWIRAHPVAYFLLGPGIGGIAAMYVGFTEAAR